ncbi:MAG TPA: hypothetical protein VGO59_16215 [Verrucomicrobiae bacterium]
MADPIPPKTARNLLFRFCIALPSKHGIYCLYRASAPVLFDLSAGFFQKYLEKIIKFKPINGKTRRNKPNHGIFKKNRRAGRPENPCNRHRTAVPRLLSPALRNENHSGADIS